MKKELKKVPRKKNVTILLQEDTIDILKNHFAENGKHFSEGVRDILKEYIKRKKLS